MLAGRFGKLDDEVLKHLSSMPADRAIALAESFSALKDREEFLAWLANSSTGAQNGEAKSL